MDERVGGVVGVGYKGVGGVGVLGVLGCVDGVGECWGIGE